MWTVCPCQVSSLSDHTIVYMTNLTTDGTLALYGKLREVAVAITHFQKRGHNDHHNYNFVQAVDVTSRVRDELLERGIIVLPEAWGAEHLPYGSKSGHLTTVNLAYNFVDTETGAQVRVPWVGVGADTGGDKGIYKAYTGGLKYALTTTFLVPTTDDPERDQITQPEGQEAHKDDIRPAAPTIPLDRATAILKRAISVELAKYNLEADAGTPPEFHPALKAKLALHGVSKIGDLNVDSAEDVELWLANEEAAGSAE